MLVGMLRALSLLSLLLLSACGNEIACTTFSSSGSARGDRRSTFRASGCADGRTYAVSCLLPSGGGTYRCSCEVGRQRAQVFHRPDPLPHTGSDPGLALSVVNAGCGWRLGE